MEQTFLECYDRNADAVFRHCWFRVRDRERAKEVTQEAFCRTWNALATGDRIDNLRAFVYRTATNLIIDDSRKRKEASLDALIAIGKEPGDDPRERTAARLDARRVLAAIAPLPDDERELLVLRYVEGLPPREIARILGISTNAATVRIFRARMKAQRLLAAHAQSL